MYMYTWGRDRLRTVLAGMIAVQSGANYQKTKWQKVFWHYSGDDIHNLCEFLWPWNMQRFGYPMVPLTLYRLVISIPAPQIPDRCWIESLAIEFRLGEHLDFPGKIRGICSQMVEMINPMIISSWYLSPRSVPLSSWFIYSTYIITYTHIYTYIYI